MSGTCEHCGGKNIYSGPPDCPRCGAPNCCQDCCKWTSGETERQKVQVQAAEDAFKHWAEHNAWSFDTRDTARRAFIDGYCSAYGFWANEVTS